MATLGRKGVGLLACLGALAALSGLAAGLDPAGWYDDATTAIISLYACYCGGNAAEWWSRRPRGPVEQAP